MDARGSLTVSWISVGKLPVGLLAFSKSKRAKEQKASKKLKK